MFEKIHDNVTIHLNLVISIAVTYIFIVPFGPKFVFITSCKPFDAEILMANA